MDSSLFGPLNNLNATFLFITNYIVYMVFLFFEDLKDYKQRDEMCAARAVLEKSTMMLLTSCKVPDIFSSIFNNIFWVVLLHFFKNLYKSFKTYCL